MDREIDLSRQQPGVQLLGPQRLAADLGQRAVLHLVAAGGDGDERDVGLGQAVGGHQARPRLLGLGHGERGTAGA